MVDLVQSGKSVFFTGSAGTGKSVRAGSVAIVAGVFFFFVLTFSPLQTLLREIVKILPRASTFVTASTGMAAINIGGITLHQFAVSTSPLGFLFEVSIFSLRLHSETYLKIDIRRVSVWPQSPRACS